MEVSVMPVARLDDLKRCSRQNHFPKRAWLHPNLPLNVGLCKNSMRLVRVLILLGRTILEYSSCTDPRSGTGIANGASTPKNALKCIRGDNAHRLTPRYIPLKYKKVGRLWPPNTNIWLYRRRTRRRGYNADFGRPSGFGPVP